jgi:hypothetical protein
MSSTLIIFRDGNATFSTGALAALDRSIEAEGSTTGPDSAVLPISLSGLSDSAQLDAIAKANGINKPDLAMADLPEFSSPK